MKNKKKTGWRIVMVLAALGIIACLSYAAWYLLQDRKAEADYENAAESFRETETAAEEIPDDPDDYVFTGEIDGQEAEIPEGMFHDLENPIDWKALAAVNPELYAWIEIPDTKINYPIAQREGDKGFYLHHDMYGNYRFSGCIYTEDENARDFTDPNTVIYGHNMKNKSMFQNLHLFEDETFFNEHPYVYIYQPDRILIYEIFAAFSYDDRHILHAFDFSDKAVYQKYIDDAFHMRAMDAHAREDAKVTTDDTIITLETCVGANTGYRYLVLAVLIEEKGSDS